MKASHFNNVFAFHCNPLDNNGKIPGNETYITNIKLSSLQFEENDKVT